MATPFELLKTVFDRDVCQRATKPLRQGVEIAVRFAEGGTATLSKIGSRLETEDRTPAQPDMTFDVSLRALEALAKSETTDIGEIGVEILKLMAHSDDQVRIRARVHIGAFGLLTHGYLGVLPLGGPAVMKFLGTKGLTNIGKIKEALSKLRG